MKRILTLIVVLVVLVVGGAFALLKFWGSDAPPEVSLSSSEPLASGDIEFAGNWKVDTTSGNFDRENEVYTASYAGYRIDEELASIGANTAVGRTPDVSGTMTILGNSITAVDVRVDMTTLESDQDRRDGAIHMRGLETDKFPTATFKLTQPITVENQPAAGEKFLVDATGDFTLHGVTKRITVPIQARWTGNRITVISSFGVSLPDYGIQAPTIPGKVLSVNDAGKVELQLIFTKAR